MEQKKRNIPKIVMIVSVIMIVISMIGSYLLMTSGSTVKVNDLNITIPSGETIRVYEYRPDSATVENPAPAVVFSHGNDSTLQSHQEYAIELARRGFVVFALDITSAGHSSQVSSTDTVGFGVYDLVDYIYYSLDYIDNSKIGIAGYSKGGNNVYDTMQAYGVEQRETPDTYVKRVSSALMIDPMFLSSEGFATDINVGFECGFFDPFNNMSFAPVEGYLPGDLTVRSEMKQFINFGAPGTFTEEEVNDPNVKVEIGEVYGSIEDGTARIVYNPENMTHASGLFSVEGIRDCVDFFEKTLGAPNPIDPSSQITEAHKFFRGLGMVGIMLLIAPLAIMLIDSKPFGALKNPVGESCILLDTKPRKAYFIISGIILSFIVPLSAPAFRAIPSSIMSLNGTAGVNEVFLNSWQNGTTSWLFINALIMLGFFIFTYNVFYRKRNIMLSDIGVKASVGGVIRTILLAVTVFVILYVIVCFADYAFKVDFRIQDITWQVLSWDHLWHALTYAPFFIFFWIANSMVMNGLDRIKGMKEWKNVLICIIFNIIGIIIVLIVHYSKLYSTGAGLDSPGNWKVYTTMLLFIPISIIGTITTRAIYKRTNNVFIGAVIYGLPATLFTTAVMMLPDYLY